LNTTPEVFAGAWRIGNSYRLQGVAGKQRFARAGLGTSQF
jgi:hypothetical protein